MELSHFEKWTLTQSVRTAARRGLRTAQVTTAMSAVTPIADKCGCGGIVRQWPKADIVLVRSCGIKNKAVIPATRRHGAPHPETRQVSVRNLRWPIADCNGTPA